MRNSPTSHTWDFFRSGGLDQVSLTTTEDLLALDRLDQKLWVALSCPVKGLELDEKTLALIDSSLSDDAAIYTISHIGDEPANVGAMAKVPDSVFQNLGIQRDLETFLKSGIFQRRLKDKEKIVSAWTEIRSGIQ